jgi:hypothetical protein
MEKLNFLRSLLGPELQRGDEYLFFCPKGCHLERPKLSINIEKGVYKCWKCGYGGSNIRKFVLEFFRDRVVEWNRLDPPQKQDAFEQKATIEEDVGWVFNGISQWRTRIGEELEQMTPQVHQYLFEKKKLTQNDLLLWNVRVARGDYSTVLVPSFNSVGAPNYYVQKTCTDEFTVARRPGVSQNQVIFNEFALNWEQPVYIVENVFDAMRFPFGSAIPILGSSVRSDSRLVEEAVRNRAELVLFLDQDEVGKKRSYSLYNLFSAYGISVKIADNPFGDIDEMENWQLEIAKRRFLSEDGILKRQMETILEGSR